MTFKSKSVKFVLGAHKAISNWELDISSKIGTVVMVGPDSLEIRLHEHTEDGEAVPRK